MALKMKPELFKSKTTDSHYIKELNGNGDIERLVIPEDVVAKWNDIDQIEVGRANYTQRAATEADVAAGKAETVGTLIEESWSRMELVNYTTFDSLLKRAEFKGKLAGIEKKYSLEDAKSLETAVA